MHFRVAGDKVRKRKSKRYKKREQERQRHSSALFEVDESFDGEEMPSTEKRAEELASGRETMKGNNHARRFLHCIGRRARVFKSERRHYRKERERERSSPPESAKSCRRD